jgi:Fungal Zn(2)-Cys(6) binuclear cluster domain
MDPTVKSDSPPSAASGGGGATSLGLEAKYSCLTCHRRKVKCDRGRPCGNCTRNNSDCEYRAPPAPRRKKKAQDQVLLAKLARYEEHMKKHGIEVEEPKSISQDEDELEVDRDEEASKVADPPKKPTPPSVKMEPGTLVLDGGKTRYLEK